MTQPTSPLSSIIPPNSLVLYCGGSSSPHQQCEELRILLKATQSCGMGVFNPLTFNDLSTISSSPVQEKISTCAKRIISQLQESSEPVFLVGYETGGLLCESVLNQLHPSLVGRITVLTFGSPSLIPNREASRIYRFYFPEDIAFFSKCFITNTLSRKLFGMFVQYHKGTPLQHILWNESWESLDKDLNCLDNVLSPFKGYQFFNPVQSRIVSFGEILAKKVQEEAPKRYLFLQRQFWAHSFEVLTPPIPLPGPSELDPLKAFGQSALLTHSLKDYIDAHK